MLEQNPMCSSFLLPHIWIKALSLSFLSNPNIHSIENMSISKFSYRFLFSLFLSIFITLGCRDEKPKSNMLNASAELAKRILPNHHDKFIFEEIQEPGSFPVFEIDQKSKDSITIRGNNTVSIASGLNYYLKHYGNSHVSWSGDQIGLDGTLLTVPKKYVKRVHTIKTMVSVIVPLTIPCRGGTGSVGKGKLT